MASSPVPRTKLFFAVRLLPCVPVNDTLLRLHPSAQMLVSRQFSTTPPVPDAQKPDSLCCVQMLSATQLVPVVSMAPPAPSTDALLMALASVAKLRTVQEVTLNVAASPTVLGSGTLRYTVLYHIPAPSMVMPLAERPVVPLR